MLAGGRRVGPALGRAALGRAWSQWAPQHSVLSAAEADGGAPEPAAAVARLLRTPAAARAAGRASPAPGGSAEEEAASEAASVPASAYRDDSFYRLSAEPFEASIAARLMRPVVERHVEIKPDGLVYLPEIFYRRVLNEAFGPGGWALMPRGEPREMAGGVLVREYALFALGRYVSQAAGEEAVSDVMGPSTAIESLKSQAMMRCCKDLGVASELWDPGFITAWKRRYAVGVRCEHHQTLRRKLLWRRADRPPFEYPWREIDAPPVSSAEPFVDEDALEAPEEETEPRRQVVADPLAVQVPPVLKRYAGRSFAEVLQDERGERYLEWVTQNFDGEPVRLAAERALEAHRKK